jgi:hypothetical protein
VPELYSLFSLIKYSKSTKQTVEKSKQVIIGKTLLLDENAAAKIRLYIPKTANTIKQIKMNKPIFTNTFGV